MIMNPTLLGITLTLIGTALNNFGIVIQKLRVNFHQQHSSGTNIPINYFKDLWWVLGIAMQVIICVPFFLLAVGYIGITLAQPLGNAGIIFLVLGLVGWLHEKLHRIEWFGIFFLIIGMIAIGVGGVEGTVTFMMFLSPNSQKYFYIFMLGAGILLCGALFIGKTSKKLRPALWGFGSGICYSFVSLGMQIISLFITDIQANPPLVYLIIGLIFVVGGTVGAIFLTQDAFKLSQAVNIVPFAQIPMNLLPVIAGLYIFNQSLLYPSFFLTGLVLIIIASSFLARLQQ
jgi:drug/metabolite transporter (DMT)-like permease